MRGAVRCIRSDPVRALGIERHVVAAISARNNGIKPTRLGNASVGELSVWVAPGRWAGRRGPGAGRLPDRRGCLPIVALGGNPEHGWSDGNRRALPPCREQTKSREERPCARNGCPERCGEEGVRSGAASGGVFRAPRGHGVSGRLHLARLFWCFTSRGPVGGWAAEYSLVLWRRLDSGGRWDDVYCAA